MKVVVTLEHRFRITPDGVAWSKVMFPYSFWTRYLDVFDEVRIVARALQVEEVDDQWKQATGPGVTFWPLPYFHGPRQYVQKYFALRASLRQAWSCNFAVILRVGSPIGALLERELIRSRHPYGLEVVGDPWDVFSPGAVRHPLRPLLRYSESFRLKRQCQRARVISYVTKEALQRRYPPQPYAFTTHYSSVELPPEAFAESPRPHRPSGERLRIVAVGTLESYYKGPDLLIDAVAKCAKMGLNLELVWVGDGAKRPELEKRARLLLPPDQVQFRGNLPSGAAVRAELDAADMFVLPSRQEGLPRAAIEAMARGLPCIGTNVGGFSELIAPQCIVPPNNVVELVRRIQWLAQSTESRAEQGKRNLEESAAYRDEFLRMRRQHFYTKLLELTTRNAPASS